jgi:Capsule assembly protein Wzi
MKRTIFVAAAASLAVRVAAASGVTPYLPLNLEPEMEAQVERVLILGGKPVLRRPIAAATVLEALPKACAIDRPLCDRVAKYLDRYTHDTALTHASAELAATHGADDPLPNRYGQLNRSAWDASLAGYLQINDYVLINLGGVGYDGRQSFTGTYLSAGFSKMQFDIGYKPHWLSPMTDSSMLMSTEAPTMPSIGISNSEPLTRLGLTYDIFDQRMSSSDHIVWQDGYTTGHPYLGGVQLTMEPVSGWSFGVNRLVQFGGGARGGGSLPDLLRALFNPSRYSNLNPSLTADQKATNQEASVTSSFLFPGRVPFAIYAEYAGEDTSHGRNYLLGNAALSWGIHFPRLAQRFDLTLEATEWQNSWYVNEIWQDGMTNDGLVVSNWFGDQRQYNDPVGGRSAMAQVLWDATFGGQVQLRYRMLENQIYGQIPYQHFHELTLGYSRPWRGVIVGAEFDSGSDVFGHSFSRLAGFVRYDDASGHLDNALLNSEAATAGVGDNDAQLFMEVGASELRVRKDLTEETPIVTGSFATEPHVALGARRAVSEHSDLGARLDFDQSEGHSLIGVRLIDYRYRLSHSALAITGFLGAARYALATPAYGFYYGLGVQWRDILPHLDLGVEARYYDNVARDRLLPSDMHTARPDSFYDIIGGVLSLSYHF